MQSGPRRSRPQKIPKALSGVTRAGMTGRGGLPTGGRTVVAVLGSVAALGGSAASAAAATPTSRSGQLARPTARTARRADPLPAGELALLGLSFASLSAAAPAIARPLLDRGVAGSTITAAEADGFLARLAAADSTPAPASAAAAAGGTQSPAAIALFQSVFSAIRAELPRVAGPLVGEAVEAETITPAAARRIEARMAVRARLGVGPVGRHTEPLFTGRLP